MNPIDFLICLSFALMASVALYLGWFPIALFCTLFFLVVLSNVCLFHVQMPQPRWIIGIGIPKKKDEEEDEESEETETEESE